MSSDIVLEGKTIKNKLKINIVIYNIFIRRWIKRKKEKR